jgi:hypothetical protein
MKRSSENNRWYTLAESAKDGRCAPHSGEGSVEGGLVYIEDYLGRSTRAIQGFFLDERPPAAWM